MFIYQIVVKHERNGLTIALIFLFSGILAQQTSIFKDTLSLCNQPTLTLDVSSKFPSTSHTYLWSTGSTAAAIVITATGVYDITVTENLTGNTSRDTVEVITSVPPVITFANAIDTVDYWGLPTPIQMSPILPHWYDYIWISPIDTTIFPFFVAEPTLLGEGLHPVDVIVEDKYGCTDMTIHDICVYKNATSCSTPTSINEIVSSNQNTEISVFPNPTKDVINFELKGIENGEVIATILNFQGATVLRKVLLKEDEVFSGEINVSTLSAGKYVLSLVSSGGASAKSFIIK